MARFVCIHGHFYQPPREHAWLERVEVQDSAHPYHDWNERITAECYAPNTRARILDERGAIAKIVNNWARISFDAGPTLLGWLERHAPETYAAIRNADRESGAAMAQGYNHAILPLCNARDKRTQVVWGLRDFEHRFGRPAAGMWLPETAVDLESLSLLAEHGVRFTVLAPHQAQDRGIDTGRPWRVALPGGREIAVFFYHAALSQAVAFERLLASGDRLARRLLESFDDPAARGDDGPRLSHLATDGESYGHHHAHGDMALARAIELLEADPRVHVTHYAAFLDRRPARDEVRIVERSAWSCPHALARWSGDCGCGTGPGGPSVAWRGPLRRALDALRDALAPRFERAAAPLLRDPWTARDAYVDVVLDRSPQSVERFLAAQARRPLDAEQRSRVLGLMELQRNALLMFTSCGWFFEEPSRLETVQVLQYAGRALQLAQRFTGDAPTESFLRQLEAGRSNLPEHGTLRQIFERRVLRARTDLARVGADHGAAVLFDLSAAPADRAFRVEDERRLVRGAGRSRLALGRCRVTARFTEESETIDYAWVYAGDHEIRGRVAPADAGLLGGAETVAATFDAGGAAAALQHLEGGGRGRSCDLATLFRDRRRAVVERILQATLDETERIYRGLHRDHAPLMRRLAGLNAPPPRALRVAAEMALEQALAAALAATPLDLERVRALVTETREEGLGLDGATLAPAARGALERLLEQAMAETAGDAELGRLAEGLALAAALPFRVDPWGLQNRFYDWTRALGPQRRSAPLAEVALRLGVALP